MQINKVVTMVVAVCAVGMLTGCGIPEEEHNAMIAELTAERAESEDKLNGKIADLESVVKSEKAKVRTNRIELDDASERIKSLQTKGAETATALASEKSRAATFEGNLATSKSSALAAQDRAIEAENKYNTLDVEYQELKRRFEMFQSNMSSLNSVSAPKSTTSAPASSGSSAPMSDADSAKKLLEEMGTL